MDEIISYQVQIKAMQNAGGVHKRLGLGTFTVNSLRDEITLTGRLRLVRGLSWLFLIFLFFVIPYPLVFGAWRVPPEPPLVFVFFVVSIGLIVLISRIPGKETSITLRQQEIGLVGFGVNSKTKEDTGSVIISDAKPSEKITRYMEFTPVGDVDAKTVVDVVTKLKDGLL